MIGGKNSINSLLAEIDLALAEYNLSPVSEIINSQDKSAHYIYKLLVERMGLIDIKPYKLKKNFSNRINHCLFTFSLGILVSKFNNLKYKIENQYKKYFNSSENVFINTWLVLSLYHDYGYFLFNDYENINNLNDFKLEYDIFTFYSERNLVSSLYNIYNNNEKSFEILEKDKEKTRYSEAIYRSYFKGSVDNVMKKEPFDHGIAGGYVLFNNLLKHLDSNETKIKNSIRLLYDDVNNVIENDLFYQNICFRIMEHNIWKIKRYDEYFKEFDLVKLNDIVEENFKKISTEEPLLYLLSLVDTIEFIKKIDFGDKKDSSTEKRVTTIAKWINIEIDSNILKISFDSKQLIKWDGYSSWIKNVISLKDWVFVEILSPNEAIEITQMYELDLIS